MQLPNGVIPRVGRKSGPSVAVFCGVRGNERAGIMAVERLINELEIDAGSVYFVFANQPAIERNVRLIDANLNRLFVRHEPVTDVYESRRAAELMNLLDSCDALLDLHSYRAPILREKSLPFAICEAVSDSIVQCLPISTVVHGFSAVQEGGTDGYMFSQGKVGICVELGALECSEMFVELGIATVKAFLSAMGCIVSGSDIVKTVQRLLTLQMMYKKTHEDCRFACAFNSFDLIGANEPIVIENSHVFSTNVDSIILFPNVTGPIGTEIFILANESTNF